MIWGSGARCGGLDVFQDPKLDVPTAPALEEADLVMISLRGDRQLPAKIRATIDERLAQTSNHERALVALFESTPSATQSSVYACLANLARQHRLDFLSRRSAEPEDQEEPLLKLVWVF